MGLNPVTDVVIMLAAVLSAVTIIYTFCINIFKNIGVFKKKEEEREKQKLKKILDELMPEYLLQHDLKTREKYLSDRERYLQEISTEVLSHTENDLKVIKQLNEEQTKIIDLLRRNTLDVLRQKIENIYYQYRSQKAFPMYVAENLEELYGDYTEGGGNHHIGKLYERMKTWDTYDELPEYEKE